MGSSLDGVTAIQDAGSIIKQIVLVPSAAAVLVLAPAVTFISFASALGSVHRAGQVSQACVNTRDSLYSRLSRWCAGGVPTVWRPRSRLVSLRVGYKYCMELTIQRYKRTLEVGGAKRSAERQALVAA